MAKLETAKKPPAKKRGPKPKAKTKAKAQPKAEAQPTTTTQTGKTPKPGEPAPAVQIGLSSKDVEIEQQNKEAGPRVDGIAAAAPAPAPGFDPKTLAPACKVLSQFGGKLAGVEVELSDDEANIVAEALAPVIDKWMPTVSSNYGEELNLLFVVLLVVGGKVTEAKAEQRNRANIGAQGDGQVDDGAESYK